MSHSSPHFSDTQAWQDRVAHEEAVEAFFAEAEEKDKEKYDEVCSQHIVQTKQRLQRVRNREITVGHLGLSPARVSYAVAMKYGVDSVEVSEGDE